MRKALGRGLDALLPSRPLSTIDLAVQPSQPLRVPISKVRPNHLQPRRYFDPQRLSELAASIRVHGLAQPLLVSQDTDGTYELIAGERRLRACELAGLKEVEVVVRNTADEQERLALALVENLQREDLNAIETALGYVRLIKEFGITQTQVGEVVGKSKQAISNTMRLLDLPEEIQKALQFGQLQEGHGRALLGVEDPTQRLKLFRQALEQKLSVRQIEDLARQLKVEPNRDDMPEPTPAPEKNADLREIETALQHRLGTKVEIRSKSGAQKGTIVLHFYTLDDFDRLVNIINK